MSHYTPIRDTRKFRKIAKIAWEEVSSHSRSVLEVKVQTLRCNCSKSLTDDDLIEILAALAVWLGGDCVTDN